MTEKEWRDRIFHDLDKIESKINEVDSKVDKIKDEMTTLKVKVAIFSSLVGSIATFIANKVFH